MWGLRKQASLLIEAGHVSAGSYTVGMILDEARIVQERLNARVALNADLMHLAISATPTEYNKAGVDLAKKAAKTLKDVLKRLRGG